MTESCIYTGTIRHRRADPQTEFRHRLSMMYLELDELPDLLGGRLLARGPGPLRFRRRDYLGDPRTDLATAVRDRVAELAGRRPEGPVRLLTQLRSWGMCFNPVSFYYCSDRDRDRVDYVLAEVTSTPWGERHSYLLDQARASAVLCGSFAKQLHVSPFMAMDHVYEARASTPAATLSVHIASLRAGTSVFDATLAMERRQLTRASAARLVARYPFATARVLALIYGHALSLKLSGARVHPHPGAAA